MAGMPYRASVDARASKQSETDMGKPQALADAGDEGPEEGELLPEKGALSSLIEDEVGLWTTDVADEQIEQLDKEDEGKAKRGHGPQRKIAKKAAYRKKRAEKERRLGTRPSKRVKLSEPPKKLCIFFLKGRCSKGNDCTFSHDCVPVTKSEPCKFLTMGCCLKGEDCPFSHDLASFPCKYFHVRGFCYDGEKCRFSHGAISEEDRKKLSKRMEQEMEDRHHQQERSADGKNEVIGTDGPDLPPGYELLPSQDMLSPLERPRALLSPDSGVEVGSICGAICTTGTHPPKNQAYKEACNKEGMHLSSKPVINNTLGMPGKLTRLEAAPAQEKSSDTDDLGNSSDLKEGENYVLLAARKAAAAAVAAGQNGSSDSRGKPGLNFASRRSRGFEGSAMELLKATLTKDEDTRVLHMKDAVGTGSTADRDKYASAMALLEGILKEEKQKEKL